LTLDTGIGIIIIHSKTTALSQTLQYKDTLKMTITWLISKKHPAAPIGVRFKSKKNRVTIDAVSGRALDKTDLVPGLRVLQVCGTDVQKATQACELIRDAPVGDISIVTEGKHHTATKLSRKEKAGFAIQPSMAHEGYVQIKAANPHGIFPDLQEGNILWSINGKKITNVRQAIQLMKRKTTLKLVVVDQSTFAEPAVKVSSLAIGDITA
jgi:hypothetical protein